MPPFAQNDKGDTLYLTDAGKWEPARVAENPQTGERMAFDGKAWQKIDTPTSYGYGDAALQGVTMGARQEVGALGRATGGALAAAIKGDWGKFKFGDAYRNALNEDESNRRRFLAENPITGNATEIGSGILTGGPAMAGAMGSEVAKRIPTVIKALLTGAGIGAGAGALEDNEDRISGAQMGGAVGLGLGAATPVVASLYGKFGKPFVDAAIKRWGKGPQSAALRRVLKDLDDDKITIDQFEQKLKAMGDETTFADAGGDAVLMRADDAATNSREARSLAKSLMDSRQKVQYEKVNSLTNKYLGTDGDYHKKVTDLMAGKSKRASKAYESAYAVPPENVNTPDIRNFLGNEEIQAAFEDAAKIARVSGKQFPQLVEATPAGPRVVRAADMESLDFVKRALDDRVSRAYRAGDTQYANALRGLRDQYRDALDQANPAYAKAREIYAGDSAIEEAMEAGRAFFRGDADEVISGFGKLKPTEQQAFREGVAREVRRTVERVKTNRNVASDLIDIPDRLNRLKAVFPNEKAYKDWVTNLDFLSRQSQTRRVYGGSDTARRQKGRDGIGVDPAPLVAGDPLTAAAQVTRTAWQRLREPDYIFDELGKVLFNADPAQQAVMLQRMRQIDPQLKWMQGATEGAGLMGAGLTGGLLGPRLRDR